MGGGGGGGGWQKSRLDLWLIERDTFLGWDSRGREELEKELDVRLMANIGGCTVIPAPGQSATIRLCLLFFLLVARQVPRQPRTCSTSASARARTRSPRARLACAAFESGFSAKIRHFIPLFSFLFHFSSSFKENRLEMDESRDHPRSKNYRIDKRLRIFEFVLI